MFRKSCYKREPMLFKLKKRIVEKKVKRKGAFNTSQQGRKLYKKGKLLDAAIHFHISGDLEKAYHTYANVLLDMVKKPKKAVKQARKHIAYTLVELYVKLYNKLPEPENLEYIKKEGLEQCIKGAIKEYKKDIEYIKVVEALKEAVEENAHPSIISTLADRAAELEENRRNAVKFRVLAFKTGKKWIEDL